MALDLISNDETIYDEVYEDDDVIIIYVTEKTALKIERRIDIAVKDDNDDVINIFTVQSDMTEFY